MKVHNLPTKEFLLAHGIQECVWLGSECSGCKQYLIPVRVPENEEINPLAWIIRPSSTQRPVLYANANPQPGLIIKVSAFDRPGKVYGKIFICRGDPILVSNGVGRHGKSLFEEALLIVQDETEVLVWYTSGVEQLLSITPDTVVETFRVADNPRQDGLNAPNLRRWKDVVQNES